MSKNVFTLNNDHSLAVGTSGYKLGYKITLIMLQPEQ